MVFCIGLLRGKYVNQLNYGVLFSIVNNDTFTGININSFVVVIDISFVKGAYF